MPINKISLMDAYMIETLRHNGITDREILSQVEKADVSPWEDLKTNFDFQGLVKLADRDPKAFQSIILNGYKIKFVTIKGIQNLLRLKFNKKPDSDYLLLEKGITGLRVDEQQFTTLKQMLSDNWVIYETSPENGDSQYKEINIINTAQQN